MPGWDEYKKTMVEPATLWSAAKRNDLAELRQLLADGSDIDARDHRGYSALMLAAYHGHSEAFELLLERGANPNSADLAGNSVLLGAAFKGHADMVGRLLARGADVTAKNHAGMDAHGFALMFGRTEIAALFSASTLSY